MVLVRGCQFSLKRGRSHVPNISVNAADLKSNPITEDHLLSRIPEPFPMSQKKVKTKIRLHMDWKKKYTK